MKKLLLLSCMAISSYGMTSAFTGTPFLAEPGEGTITPWVRNSIGLVDFSGFLTFSTPDDGGAVDFVIGENGKVWVNHILSSFPTTGWAEGIISDNRLTFTLPQAIYQENGMDYYLAMVTKDTDERYYLSQNQTLVFDKAGDSWVSTITNDKEIVAIVTNQGEFTNAGDYKIEFYPFEEPTPVDDSGVDYKDYAFLSDVNGHFVKVGITDDKVYIAGLLADDPDRCIAGTRSGNTVTFKSGAYLGISEEASSTPHYNYFSAVVENEEDDFDGIESLTFDLNPTTGELTTDGTFVYNHSDDPDIISYWDYFEKSRFFAQNPNMTLAPANPTKVVYSYRDNSVVAYIPQTSMDGYLLDADMLYYQIYINGQIKEFYQDDYKYLDMEEMIQIPYFYTEEYDFIVKNSYHEFYLYDDNVDVVGVQCVYDCKGGPLYSDIVNSDGTIDHAGVETILSDKSENGSVQYFDILGRKVTRDTQGLILRRSGSKTTKLLR